MHCCKREVLSRFFMSLASDFAKFVIGWGGNSSAGEAWQGAHSTSLHQTLTYYLARCWGEAFQFANR